MTNGFEDTIPTRPDHYAALNAAQKTMVERHMYLLKACKYPEINNPTRAEAIKQTTSSPQGIQVLSEVIAATEAWKKNKSIKLPKALSTIPSEGSMRDALMLERHKTMIRAANPSQGEQEVAKSLENASAFEGLQVLQQIELLRYKAARMSVLEPRDLSDIANNVVHTAGKGRRFPRNANSKTPNIDAELTGHRSR